MSKLQKYAWISIVIFMLFFIGACNQTSNKNNDDSSSKSSPKDFQDSTNDLSKDIQETLTNAQSDEGFKALNVVFDNLSAILGDFWSRNSPIPNKPSPQAIVIIEKNKLPRGKYNYDNMAKDFVFSSDSENLDLNWTYENNKPANAIFNWGSNLKEVENIAGDNREVPTSTNFTLMANNTKVADLTLQTSWYNTDSCGTTDGILEPSKVALNGNVAIISLTNVGLSIGSNSVNTQGKIAASSSGKVVSLEWDIGLNGPIRRGPCFFKDIDVQNGNASLVLSSDSHSFAFGFDFSDITYQDGSIASIKLSNGEIKIDNKTALTFAGTLDDSDSDGVVGENVKVTFANGEISNLEEIIINNRDIFTSIPNLASFSLLDTQQILPRELNILSIIDE